jgi:hypothetical protein
MLEKFKKIAGAAKDAAASTVSRIGDFNGDGKLDKEDALIAAEWAKKASTLVADEAMRLSKTAIRSDLVKDAASGAAVGAAVAVPLPLIGPIAGGVIGAGLGVYKNLTKKEQVVTSVIQDKKTPIDVHAELLKLDELRQKNIITEAEFESQKKRILDSTS